MLTGLPSPWPLKTSIAGSSKEIPIQLYLNPLLTLDKLPFRLGIQVCMEENFAILLELGDGSGLTPVGKSVVIGQELGVTLGVGEQTIGCRV